VVAFRVFPESNTRRSWEIATRDVSQSSATVGTVGKSPVLMCPNRVAYQSSFFENEHFAEIAHSPVRVFETIL
jgi:hypothetical protein